MNINDEWEKALNGYANIKWNTKQEQPKSPVGDIKKSSERYEPIVGGFINGISSLERLAYQAMGGLDAQLTGWSTNQQTRNTGDIERYRQSYENNPVLQKTALTPEEYEKKRYETPTFWGQVLGGVDQKTKYTEEQAEALRQQRVLEAEKPWMDKANNVEDVRYTRLPSGTLEEIAVDAAVNTPQLGEAGLAAAVPYIGPVLSVASMAKNIYGSAYGDTRRKGYSPDAAHGAAAIDTLYQMPFEYTGASRIFKTIPGLRRAVGKLSPEGKSKFAEWLKTVASEGSTEFAQTYGDSSADDIADAIERGDFQKDFEARAKSAGNIIYKNTLGDKAEENFKESAYAGLLGGVMGGGAHGVGIAMDAVARKLAGNPNPTQEDVVQAILKAKNDIAQDSGNDGDNPTGGDNSFGNDVLNFLHNQTDVQMTEGQMRNLAAAMAGNAFQESGYDSTAENSIGAYGSFQHLGERRAALEAFAEENGLDPSSRQAQIAFAWKEMMTEGTLENQAFQSIMGLEDNQAKEAAVIYRKLFERPGEEEANDEARMTEAQRVHDSFTQAQQFLKDTAERMDIATEEDAALANELNRLAEEGREEEVLAKARELGFREQREKELNQQREQIAQQTEEEQNNIPEAPQAAPTPQGQAGQLAPIQTENMQAPQTQQQPAQGMETVNKDRTAPHIDRNKANKGNFNNRGNYNGRLDAPQNKRVESPIRNQGQSAPISQQGENQNAENLQTQTTQRRENRENLNENAQPQQTQTAENQAITQNPQGNEVTPTLAPSNQGTAGIAQNVPKIASNGQNGIANKVSGEALAKAAENDLATVSGETKDTSQTGEEVNNAPLEAILEEVNAFPWANDSTISAFKKAVDAKVRAVREGAMSAKTAKSVIRGAYTRAYKRLDERFLKKEIDRQEFNALNQTMSDMMNQASRMMKPENVAIYRGRKGNNNTLFTTNEENAKSSENILDDEANAADEKTQTAKSGKEANKDIEIKGEKPNKEETVEVKETPQKEGKPVNETADKEDTKKAEKTVKEEAKAPQEKPQKTKAQQKADAERDAKAKKLLTKDAYDKVYTPLVNVLEQAQPEVAKAARDTALLMAKTADILHKRFKMKWENAPRVLLGESADEFSYFQSKTGYEKNLVAMHNISVSALSKAIKLGGLPVPSIAITKKQTPYTEFGDVTLIMRKDVADPKKTPIYDRDAWTAVFPKLVRKGKRRKIVNFIEKVILPTQKEIPRSIIDYSNMYTPSIARNADINDLQDIVERFLETDGAQYLYLKSVEKAPKPVKTLNEKGISVIDYDAFHDSLRKKMSSPAAQKTFHDWQEKIKDELLEAPVIKETGEEPTLENITDIMLDGLVNEQRTFFGYGVGNAIAASAKQINTLEEMHRAADTKMEISEDAAKAYHEVRDRVTDFVWELSRYYKYPSDWDSTEHAAKVIGEMVGNGTPFTKAAKKYGIYNAEALLDKANQIVEEIQNLKVNYFEGKPQRAVTFDEVAVAVLPKGTPLGMAQYLNRHGVKVKRYDPKIEGDRERVTNEAQERAREYFETINTETTEAEKNLEADTQKWVALVDEYRKTNKDKWRKYKNSKIFDFMHMPLVLQLIGYPKTSIKAYGSFFEHSINPKHPGMTTSLLKQLPKAMTDPMFICRGTAKNSVVMALELKDSRGATVVAVVEFSKNDKRYGIINLVATAYSKNGGENKPLDYKWVASAFDQKNLLYINKKKSTAWIQGIRGSFPMGPVYLNGALSNGSIKTEDDFVKLKEENPSEYQRNKDQIAGSYNAVENLIKVFEKGNASTAIHESAHWYLVTLENLLHAEAEKRGITGTTDEILEQLAEDETMPKDLVSELQKIRNWAQYSEETMKEYEGTELEKEFTKLAEAIKSGDEDAKERFIQERFARGYERYLASGKAPTKELQGVFARFRRWLLDIYNNTIKNLGNKPAPKEIQEIFDRMLEMEETESGTTENTPTIETQAEKIPKTTVEANEENEETTVEEDFTIANPNDTPLVADVRQHLTETLNNDIVTKALKDPSPTNANGLHKMYDAIETYVDKMIKLAKTREEKALLVDLKLSFTTKIFTDFNGLNGGFADLPKSMVTLKDIDILSTKIKLTKEEQAESNRALGELGEEVYKRYYYPTLIFLKAKSKYKTFVVNNAYLIAKLGESFHKNYGIWLPLPAFAVLHSKSTAINATAGSYHPSINILKISPKNETAETFIHETTHMYYHMLQRFSNMTDYEITKYLDGNKANAKEAMGKIRQDLKSIDGWLSYSEEHLDEYKGTPNAFTFYDLARDVRSGKDVGEEVWRSERLAYGVEQYIRTGKAPTKTLERIFNQIKEWIKDYVGWEGAYAKEKSLPPEVIAFYEKMLNGTPTEKIKEKPKAKKNYPSGKTVNARTDKADEFPVTYKLIPIEDAITSTNEDFSINENFPQELQPRDRDRSGMKNQIKDIAGNLSPEEMTIAVKVSEGAPIINQDNIVENGNGRILALLRAYKGGSDAYDESAKRYKAYLREHAADFGFTAEQVDAIERPLLVRQRGSESDNLQRNIVESTSGGMKMSAGQQAKVDAKKISLHTLSLYNYDGSGDLDLASNGRFVKAVLDETISQYDQDSMFTADGSISRDAKNRVNNALCALAYGDTDLLDRVSESSDNDYKNYVSAYTIAAPRVAYAKKLMESGDVSEDFDVAKMLNETLEFVLQCKKENVTVSEKLRAGAGLFKGNSSQFEMDGSREFAKFLGNNIRKQRKMADTIKEIADGVYKKAAAGQTSGFFGEDNTTFYDIVRNALGMGNSQFNTNDEMCTLSTKDEAFSVLTKNQEKSLTAVAKDYGGTYDENTHTYTFPDEISLEEAREEMDALLDPTRLDFKESAQGKLVEKMRKDAKMLSEDELTDREKGIVAFAEKMGVKLRFFEGDSRLHGFQSDDVIYLNRNSAMNLNQVFWHETFHWLKRNNPKLYEALEKAVLQNDDIAAQVKAWQEKTGRTNLTEEEAIEEMLADAMLDASTRGKFFETLGITHPTLVQKLIKWIKNTYRDLVNQFRHTEGFKPEAGLTNTQINRMSVALDNMALKLVDGNGNKLFSKDAKGNLKENTVKDVRYVDGAKYLVTNKNLKADDVVKVVHLLSGGIDIENENVTQRAKRLTKDLMGKQFKLQNDGITLKTDDKDNVNHFIVGRKNTWYQKGKKRALSKNKNIKRLIENSVYVESRQSYHEDRKNLDYVKFYAVGKVDERYIRFEIGAYKDHDGTYTVSSVSLYNLRTKGDINPSAIKKGGWNTHHQNGGDFTGGSSSSFIRIADMLEGVKDEDKNLYVINGELQRNDKLVVWTATDSSQLLSEGFKNQDTQQDTPQDTQQDTEKYSVDLSDLENGKVFNNEEQNKKAQAVQKSMELAKDSDTKHFMSKFAGKLFGQKEYDTRKNVAIEGQKDYRQRAKDVSLYGVLTQIISPSRLKDERLKTIYIEGEKAKRTQAKLYSKWTEKHKKILDLVEKAEDYAGYVRALLSEDSERRVFTDDELREMGCSDKVIEAHKQVRALLKEIRDKIAEVYLAKHFEVKNFKTQVEAEAWAANPFFEKVEIKPMKKVGGTVWQVKYDTVPYTKTEETVTKWELDKLKEREGRGEIHILESAKVDDTMCTVSYLTPQRTLADLDQYIPHFFHEFLIIEKGKGYTKVVGSATTMDEAVEIGNKLAGQKGNEKKQYTITPKGLSFEDGSNSLGIVNKELDELMDGIKDDLSIDLSEAIEAKKQKGKHIFLSALQHRKGAKGWETNLRWVIQHHIGTAARYCALDPYKVKVINYFEKAWGSFADNFVGKDLKAEFAQGLINSVLGVPTRAEKVSDAILELCPLFRNTPQASRVLSSTMLGVMSVLKLGVSPAAAFVNLTQLVNIQGYIGAKWTYEGISRAWKKSKEDMALLDELGTREEAGLETVDISEATALIAGKYDKQLRQLKKLSDLSMKAFTKAESLLRQAAVLGAYHKALAEGKTEAAARSYALEVNRKANFNYGIEDAPRLFRMLKGSVVGDLFLQFKKYGFKELEVIYDMAFDKSIPKSQKLSFFGAYFLLGGIFNALPFQDTMIELLGLALDSDDPEAEMKEWIMKWAKGSEAKKIVALTAMYGAGSWIGADVSQRVGFRGLTPELEEPLGVTGSTIKQVCTAMLNGDSVGFAKGLSPALGNVVGATKGYNTDSKGRVAYVYKDPLERALRLCGFRTIGEALSVDTQRIVTEARKEKEKERKEAKETYLENPSYANKQKLKQLGYTDGEIKKFKGNNDSLERTERLKARMTKQELKDFKDVLDW